jgi:hypothetical protein
LTREGEVDELTLVAANAAAAQAFTVGQSSKAKFMLKDGRTLELPVVIQQPRPRVTTLSRDVQIPAADAGIHLTDQGEVPQDGGLTFSLKTVVPAIFPRTEKIEVGTDDDSLHTTLSLADSSLVLEDATTMLATLDPRKSFGPSIFGPLRYRPVEENGTKGDWQPLGTVVRLPIVAGVACPRLNPRAHVDVPLENAPPPPAPADSSNAAAATLQPGAAVNAEAAQGAAANDAAPQQATCTLRGNNLFLIDSVASDAAFTHSIQIPEGFSGQTINVPRPIAKTLYVKLRDDPDVVNTLQLP